MATVGRKQYCYADFSCPIHLHYLLSLDCSVKQGVAVSLNLHYKISPTFLSRCLVRRQEDGVDIVALGVTRHINERELKGISGMEFVTQIDVFDEFHELATILLEASEFEIG